MCLLLFIQMFFCVSIVCDFVCVCVCSEKNPQPLEKERDGPAIPILPFAHLWRYDMVYSTSNRERMNYS